MTKLWQKNKIITNKIVDKFLSTDDVLLDNHLVKWDIYGSIAHITMLQKINLLSKSEYEILKNELIKILKLYEGGRFKVTLEDEDVHTKIENYITETIGNLGKKIHTGRSRNDQVLVDLRLYSKNELFLIIKKSLDVCDKLFSLAHIHKDVPMPGYTHMQKAMPSSVGLWFGAYAESILDATKTMINTLELIDQSPLGSGASYGIPLPLDRQLTADLLGFHKVLNNSLYAQNSRGKFEAQIVQGMSMAMYDISKFSTDLLLFTTSEFNYFSIDEMFTTGSSIMPQKRNLDVAELLRSKFNILNSAYIQIITTTSNLPSGYNRDFQDTKKPLMESFTVMDQSLEIFLLLISSITVKKESLEKSMTSELFATHSVLELTKHGTAFRDAYGEVGNNLKNVKNINFMSVLNQSTHQGSVGNLSTEVSIKKMNEMRFEVNKSYKKFKSVLHTLTQNYE
jgi:argininosuccinate lyase